MEELAGEVHRGALAVACVRPSSIIRSSIMLTRRYICSLLWGVSAPFLGAYTLILNLSVPLILEPHFFGSLCLVSWCQVRRLVFPSTQAPPNLMPMQCQHYAHHRSWRTSTFMTLAIALLLAGFEAGLVFGLRPLFDAGSAPARHATQFLGIFGSVLIGLGLVPQFVEIWRRREVVGISKLLLALDMLGGVCMDLSLAFKDRFDVVTGITYTLIVVRPFFRVFSQNCGLITRG